MGRGAEEDEQKNRKIKVSGFTSRPQIYGRNTHF